MREFRQTKGRTGERYWVISFEAAPGQPPEVVVTKWGSIKDGKKKQHGETKDRPGPKGKINTKAHMDAADNAAFKMDRLIRKKTEEGYVEVGLDGRPLVGGAIKEPQYDAGMEIDFTEPLPKNLCFSKPKNTVTDKFVAKLEKDENLLLTRKMNGMLVVVQVDHNEVPTLYTRRMDSLTNHFPHLTLALMNMDFPAHSILLFEAFMGDGNKKSDLLQVQSIMRSKAPKAVQAQEDFGWMKFYLLRIPVWEGQYLEQSKKCGWLCHMIENSFAEKFMAYEDKQVGEQFLFALENFDGTVAEADAEAEANGYEGWVGYKKDAVFGEYSFSFHGKPDRPSCCFKRKAEYEDDFIAYFDPDSSTKEFKQGSFGNGKNMGLLGTMSLYQTDPNSGEMVYICECGGGFTDKQRRSMMKENYPLVASIKYTSRQYTSDGEDTNALEFPRFGYIHPDKTPEEVVNPKIKAE